MHLTGIELWQRMVMRSFRDWLEEPENDKAYLESLLLAASDDYESSQDPTQQPSAHGHQVNTASHSHSRFAPPKSDEEIRLARAARIPEKTRRDAKYCVNAWKSEN